MAAFKATAASPFKAPAKVVVTRVVRIFRTGFACALLDFQPFG
jgi:hypothetical protein